MEATKWLKPSSIARRSLTFRLLLWVNNGSPAWASECPFLGVKRTSSSDGWGSVHSQTQTFECHPIGIDFPDCGR